MTDNSNDYPPVNQNQTPPTTNNNPPVQTPPPVNNPPATTSTACNSNSPSTIKVLSPNGGETFTLGQTINIKWSSKCIDSNEKISVSIYKKGAQLSQEGSPYGYTTNNTGYYNWTIPKDINSNQYEVSIGYILTNGNATYDNSDGLFTINTSQQQAQNNTCTSNTPAFMTVISPNSGTYHFGDIITVKWQACNTSLDISQSWIDRFNQSGTMVVPNLRISDLSLMLNYQKQIIGNGATGSFDIKIPNNGQFNDPVDGTINLNNSSIKYRVRIEAFDGPSDSSNNYFTIIP